LPFFLSCTVTISVVVTTLAGGNVGGAGWSFTVDGVVEATINRPGPIVNAKIVTVTGMADPSADKSTLLKVLALARQSEGPLPILIPSTPTLPS